MNETRRPADSDTGSLQRNTSRDPGYRAGYEDGFATGAELGRARKKGLSQRALLDLGIWLENSAF